MSPDNNTLGHVTSLSCVFLYIVSVGLSSLGRLASSTIVYERERIILGFMWLQSQRSAAELCIISAICVIIHNACIARYLRGIWAQVLEMTKVYMHSFTSHILLLQMCFAFLWTEWYLSCHGWIPQPVYSPVHYTRQRMLSEHIQQYRVLDRTQRM